MNEELLNIATQNLIIHDIYLQSSDINMNREFIPTFQKDPLLIQFKNQIIGSVMHELIDHTDFNSLVVYQYEVGFRALPQKLPEDIISNEDLLKGEILTEVTAIFNAAYFAKNKIEEDAIKEFGLSNVGFNVWPYWREYASSVANRMSLPHFIVPLRKHDMQSSR